ncbi:25.3 kDa vesicle transport protein-like isoform X2 [Rosa chinensis]|uniref:25.3 kDa vesicle transport protein-like isoform X2 n=1 Tax=Rosa chinensis TaxID=74649 RepID=UPI000D088703|nr:25.3 kDa vesicle transport protein-like isoform X2 [Rosa chinensis]
MASVIATKSCLYSISQAFNTFIQRTKKLYQDTCTQRTISKLNNELYEVHQIMTCNVQEVLGVGEKLDYKARDLNQQALIRKWAPVAMLCRC